MTKIGPIGLASPFAVAPMAGLTDSAFRRLVKRHGGCGLVVTEMVSSEGLIRGIDRTLEYTEYTEEERPVSVQIFGGDPARMAAAAQIVEGMGADIVDVNMGCPVPKIAKHTAGCSLMREPERAADIVAAMTKAVRIPVTVKMRAGWDDGSLNAPDVAKRVEAAGAAAVAVHGRSAAQSYAGLSDWGLIARVAEGLAIPVFGSGDCVEARQIVDRLADSRVAGVLVGRGVLRNPWILAQARDLADGRAPRAVTLVDRGHFLLDYMTLLLNERAGFRHLPPNAGSAAQAGGEESSGASGVSRTGGVTVVVSGFSRTASAHARGREKWVINKLRALTSWYSKGFDNGSHLRVRINGAQSIAEVREIIDEFFFAASAVRSLQC